MTRGTVWRGSAVPRDAGRCLGTMHEAFAGHGSSLAGRRPTADPCCAAHARIHSSFQPSSVPRLRAGPGPAASRYMAATQDRTVAHAAPHRRRRLMQRGPWGCVTIASHNRAPTPPRGSRCVSYCTPDAGARTHAAGSRAAGGRDAWPPTCASESSSASIFEAAVGRFAFQ